MVGSTGDCTEVSLKLMKAAETKHSGKSQAINIPAPKFHVFKSNSEAVLSNLLQVIKIRPSKHIHKKNALILLKTDSKYKAYGVYHPICD